MKILIESFFTGLIIAICAFLAVDCINAASTMNNAKQYQANCVGIIEQSNFDGVDNQSDTTKTVGKLKKEASDKGYTLIVDGTSETKHICPSCNTVFDSTVNTCPTCGCEESLYTETKRLYSITLKYTIKINLLGIEKEGSITSYAR